MESYDVKIIYILAIGFAYASVLGYLCHKIKLSPIVGYLLAGYLIGPYSPGFVANLPLSEQLAEIGVILMMFGVGLHLNFQDLFKVKNIAIPGAIGQMVISTVITAIFFYADGWNFKAGIIVGVAISVASTAVLVRILLDHHLLQTPQGHLAIGWLIVEDILTVIVLVLLPILAIHSNLEPTSYYQVTISIAVVILKFIILFGIIWVFGQKIVAFILSNLAKTRSHELFTLTLMALVFGIAIGSSYLFGSSIALGAFLAGMIVGQTDLRKQAEEGSMPIQDAFVVVFFITIGMLFNPSAIVANFFIFIILLGIILLVKPVVAFLIMLMFRYPLKLAVGISLALGQIGEFSFILAEQANRLDLIPDEAYDIIVACSIISIAINPFYFKATRLKLVRNL